ncbi:hypothetical protein [Novilysobacter arseniciresistens]|nr:hypothetical protein [Lysobacter arseniciresistens]
MPNPQRDTTKGVLDHHYELAVQLHMQLLQAGIIIGSFDADHWIYQGKRVSLSVKPSDDIGDSSHTLIRCFALSTIRAKLGHEALIGRVRVFKLLCKWIVLKGIAWQQLNAAVLNSLVASWKDGHAKSTVYHRANDLTRVVEFLHQLHVSNRGRSQQFLPRHIRWKHCVPNPIRSALEQTSGEFKERRRKNYREELHIGLATVRAHFLTRPDDERIPGYDRIRLESLAFNMALGLRVGEVTTLPIDAMQFDKDVDAYFVKVATEKTALAGARAVPDVWVEALMQANAYLIEACQGARARAKQIETDGFAFLRERLLAARRSRPCAKKFEMQLEAVGLDRDAHFLLGELTAAFDVSYKEFCAGGRYHAATVRLPAPARAGAVLWLDKRFERWDWSEFGRLTKKRGGWSLLVGEVAMYAQVPRPSLEKPSSFLDGLRSLLAELSASRQFEPSAKPDAKKAEKFRKKWPALRALALARRGGNNGIVVDIAALERLLDTRYRKYLSVHFKENMYDEGSELGFISQSPRSGVAARLSDHLIVVWENQFHNGACKGLIPKPLLRAEIYNYLSSSAGKPSVFERLDIRDSTGEIFSFSPHAIRRWVTTALLRSGPNETAVDVWMGRSPRQSRHYDYRTARERADFVRDRYLATVPPPDFLGRKVEYWRQEGLTDATIEDLIAEKLRVLHFTPWGACSRELYISPCDRGLMCLKGFGTDSACSSFHLDVNDEGARLQVLNLRDNYLRMLNAVEPKLADLSSLLQDEIESAEPLDQHVAMMREMVRSCEAALDVMAPPKAEKSHEMATES